MKPQQQKLIFLLGANTPSGFVSKFDQLVNPDGGFRTYIIKGGPGCGKSGVLRKIASAFAQDPDLELIACAHDIDSLDAVIVPSKKLSVVDGSRPHLLEPAYPGAVESIVDLSPCWDADMLHSCREEIVRLTRDVSRCHDYCCRYLAAGTALLGDSHRLALGCVDIPKLNGYLSRLSDKELKRKDAGTIAGKEKVRFLTAITGKEVVKHTDSAKTLARRIYLIGDEYGAVSRLMLHRIRADALAGGYDIVSCYCPLVPFDKLEHLFIPALSLGFMTSNRFHNFDLEISAYRIINCQRFTENERLKEHKKRMGFNRKAAVQMIAQAQTLLGEASSLHKELESYYTGATDFDKVDKLTEDLLAKLARLP